MTRPTRCDYELTLPYARPPISQNDRPHWAQAARLKKQISDDTQTLAVAAKLPRLVPFVDVVLVWYPADMRRRDTDNPAPTLKAAVDGLVADDGSSHVRSECRIGPVRPGGVVTLEITIQRETVAA